MKNVTVMKKIFLSGVLLALVFCAAACVVHERTVIETPADISERIDNQQRLIDSGISSGTLAPAEAKIVKDNLNGIKIEYAKGHDEGRLTPYEIDRLERLLDRNARMINHGTVPMRMYR